MSSPFRLAIIGSGSVAQFHTTGFTAAGITPAAFCDPQRERAERFAAQHDGAAVFDDHRALLDSGVNAVVVAVPNDLHRDLAVAALAAGVDVLLEKPMALSVAQCDEIIAAARRHDRILQLGFVCRQAPAVRAAKRLIDAGRVGRVHHIKVSVYRRRGIPGLGRWFTTRARSGGGVLIDLGVHLIDLVMHITGDRAPARASGAAGSIVRPPLGAYIYGGDMWAGPPDFGGTFDVEDSITALLRFEGFTVELNATWASNIPGGAARDGVLVLGDRGGLAFEIWGDHIQLAGESDGHLVDTRIDVSSKDAWVEGWKRQSRSFADSVAAHAQPEAGGHHGRDVQRVVEAIYRSCAEGREVEV